VISTTIYAIRWAHLLKNLTDPTENMFVKNLLDAAQRCLSKPVTKKEPVTTDMLLELCSKHTNSTDLLIVRDFCMI
jgi:hypothetical protein